MDLNYYHLMMLFYSMILTWCNSVVNQPNRSIEVRFHLKRIFLSHSSVFIDKITQKGEKNLRCGIGEKIYSNQCKQKKIYIGSESWLLLGNGS